MLTGYIGSATFLDAIEGVVDRVKDKSPNLKYVCDPVLGDVENGVGNYYVPEELVGLFRTKIIPKSFMITPNQFEAEKIS
jgi:pyridoxine kinase